MRTSFTIPGGLMLGRLDCVTGDTVAITADRATGAQWRQARIHKFLSYCAQMSRAAVRDSPRSSLVRSI
jgi:hypothetical protein